MRRPPRPTRTDTLFPYTTLFRSHPPLSARPAGRGAGRHAGQAGRLRKGDHRPMSAAIAPAPALLTRPRIGFLGVGWIGRNRMEAMLATGGIEEIGERRVGKACVSTCRSRGSPVQ